MEVVTAKNRQFDVAIIGGGPAGASCAVWLARLGFAPVLLEAGGEVGGLCRSNPFHDDWNASLPGMTGAQVADNLAASLEQARVPVRLSYRVRHLAPLDDGFEATPFPGPGHEESPGGRGRPGDSEAVRARYIVLATGVIARGLPQMRNDAQACPGFPDASGRVAPVVFDSGRAAPAGVLVGPGEHVVAHDFRNQRVAVLGGGDNAFENALYAQARGAASVHVYARGVRAQRQFVRKFPAADVRLGDCDIDLAARTVNGVRYDTIMVFYGWRPCAQFADALALRRTDRGFIATDIATAETSHPGVYAIGEVAQRQHPCVVTALADGVTAAKAIQVRMELA